MPSKQSTTGERYTFAPPALNSVTSVTTSSSGRAAWKPWAPSFCRGALAGRSSGSPASEEYSSLFLVRRAAMLPSRMARRTSSSETAMASPPSAPTRRAALTRRYP